MGISAGYADFVRDLLSGFGPVSIRRMFGGAGVYHDGVMFGLVSDDTLYLRADEASAARFEAEGKGPFTYVHKDRGAMAMPYRELPERLFEDTDELAEWAAQSFAVACREKRRRDK